MKAEHPAATEYRLRLFVAARCEAVNLLRRQLAQAEHPRQKLRGRLRHGVEHGIPAAGVREHGERGPDAIPQFDLVPVARPAGERVVGVCRHFTLLHVAMLRAQGVAARARCGFGAYFEKGKFVDHWVTEYWNEAQKRWVLVDSQLDTRQRELFKVTFDPLDVPRDQFVVAGDAWKLCRGGKADSAAFGILDMHGLWFIAGNVIRDVAALNNHEMLPWDIWGAMARNDAELDLPFFDRLAELSHAPDEHADELRAVYEDKRIAVPRTVFNAVLNRPDPVH